MFLLSKSLGPQRQHPDQREGTRVAFAPCLAVVYTFLPIKVLSLVFRGVISSLPPYIGKHTMPYPYRREELIADTATLVYLLSDPDSIPLHPHYRPVQ
jgi:hypothetical protein